MHMNVHKTRRDYLSRQIALYAFRHLKIMSDLDDHAVADENVCNLIKPDLRVDKARPFKHQRHRDYLLTIDT